MTNTINREISQIRNSAYKGGRTPQEIAHALINVGAPKESALRVIRGMNAVLSAKMAAMKMIKLASNKKVGSKMNYVYNIYSKELSATVSDSTLDNMDLTYSLVSDIPLTPDEVTQEIEKRQTLSYWKQQFNTQEN